jgi:deoxyribonuclease-4
MPAKHTSDLLGFHISVAEGLQIGLEYASANNCRTAQIFAGSKLSASLKDKTKYDLETRLALKKYISTNNIHLFIHSVYVINMCKYPASSGRSKYIHANLLHDLQLASDIGAVGVIIHLGSSIGNSKEDAIANLVSNIIHVVENIPHGVKLILESSSGQGNQVGVSLEEFHTIYSAIPAKLRAKIGICLDTAHIAASGVFINTIDGVKSYLAEFNRLFGIDKLVAVHLNDNPYPVGSRRDVHEVIGHGALFKTAKNLEALKWLLATLQKNKVSVILETSGAGKEGSSYPAQIAYLRKLIH